MNRILSRAFAGFLILAIATALLPVQPVSAATPTELFFSEYIEGSSNNKALEIYNGTGAAIDLAAGGYNIQMHFNGNPSPSLTINLTGSVADGDVYVVAQASANATILAQADQTNGSGWFNGDDAIVLRKGTTVLDVIGQIGSDPGSEWGSGLTSTADNTLRRLADLCAGDPDGSNAFDPALEWEGFAVDTFDGLGAHTANCGGGETDSAPAVSSTIPANAASDVSLASDITINFSEPVNVAEGWFSISCSNSGIHSAAVSGDAQSFVLNPDTDFSSGENCTVTVNSASISDQDEIDPPDTLEADYTFSFNTLGPVCDLPFTPIYQIQGNGAAAAISGVVTTQGVVVGDYEGASPAQRGFFLQDLNGDGDESTSDGIFVFNGTNNSVSLGQVVRVTGSAGEFQEQTQISSVTSLVDCGSIASVEPVDVTLPFPSATFAEQYEGMLVRLPQTLYVTEHFQLGRFGQVVMSSEARLQQPTNVTTPGVDAIALQTSNNLNRIIIDDAIQNQNPDPILFGRDGQPLSASNTLRGGDTATGIVGVMTYTWAGNSASGNAYRVRPINALNGSAQFVAANPRPDSAPEVGGTLKVAGMNLLNFFNTFDGLPDNTDNCSLGVGGGATDCRGADTQAEFDRQWPKTVAAILALDADVVGINEIENDGYGPDSSIAFLVDRLNEATAPGTYAFIDVDTNTGEINALGTDAIKVGMLYKTSAVTPVGQTAALNSLAFVNGGDGAARNRPSLAQAFEQNSTGARFIVNINHLKSKGSACEAPDAGDGQGNCNQVRVNAATELVNWLATNPTGTADPDILLIGDYNSYAMEDPITVIKNAGFTNLIESFLGPDAYSYVFDGQWGYLDHALGSASLVSQITGVGDYHINADEPSVLDYNTDFKTANLQSSLYAPDQFRVSDHDPVIVGLDLNVAPTVSAGEPYSVDEGGSVTLNATGSDLNNDPLTYEWDLDNDGVFETAGQSVPFAGVDGPATQTVAVRVSDDGGLSANASTTVTVNNLAPAITGITVPTGPVNIANAVNASASFSDAGTLDTHTALWDWGDGSTSAGTVSENNGSGSVADGHTYSAPGLYTVTLTVTDKDGASHQAASSTVLVYNPKGGFATGGGWYYSPAGAYLDKPTKKGSALVAFVVGYKKNAETPSGEFQMIFHLGGLRFRATSFDWLIIDQSAKTAQFQGSGKINNAGNYKFTVWADQDNPDTIRVKIWYSDETGEHVIYDTVENLRVFGSIVVHR